MIKIVTGAIRSGKTTALERWLARGGNGSRASGETTVAGFLTPDGPHGRKVLRVLPSGETADFEVPCDSNVLTVEIGPFCFLSSTFEYARAILTRAATDLPAITVVDELGKLELRGEGFEPALSALISAYRELPDRLLVLVIRDFLLAAAREHFRLPDDFLEPTDDPSG